MNTILRSKYSPVLKSAALIVLSVMIAGSTGCSWFSKKKKTEVTSNTASKPVPPTTTVRPPADDVPRPEIESIEPIPTSLMNVIYFDYDNDGIRADQVERIEHNLKYLQDNPSVKVQVEGNCDERGTTEYNISLGERRANSVIDYFIKNGISAERFRSLSRGEENSVDSGHDESAWQKNRRCEFFSITYKRQ